MADVIATRKAIIVVPAAQRAAANTLAQQVDATVGAEAFNIRCVPAPGAPDATPTHYACLWACTETQYQGLAARLDTQSMRNLGVSYADAALVTLDAHLASRGLQRYYPAVI